MSFKLTILGSGSAVPTLYRAVTSQYLNFNERKILIDCGEGTQMQLRKYRIKFQRIQFILISHLHGDHFQGLFGLLSSMNLTGRSSKLTIFCPPGLEEYYKIHKKVTRLQLRYEVEFIELVGEDKQLIFEDKMLRIFSFPLKHRIPTYGFLFQEKDKELRIDKRAVDHYGLTVDEIQKAKQGLDIDREKMTIPNSSVTIVPEAARQYAYCSDTAFNPKIVPWIEGVDILYHEATFAEKDAARAKSTMHSTAHEAAYVAGKAKAKQLLLGHFSARYKSTELLLKEAKTFFPDTVCVEDGESYVL